MGRLRAKVLGLGPDRIGTASLQVVKTVGRPTSSQVSSRSETPVVALATWTQQTLFPLLMKPQAYFISDGQPVRQLLQPGLNKVVPLSF